MCMCMQATQHNQNLHKQSNLCMHVYISCLLALMRKLTPDKVLLFQVFQLLLPDSVSRLHITAPMADIHTAQLQPDYQATTTATDSVTFLYLQTLVSNTPGVWSIYSIVTKTHITQICSMTSHLYNVTQEAMHMGPWPVG